MILDNKKILIFGAIVIAALLSILLFVPAEEENKEVITTTATSTDTETSGKINITPITASEEATPQPELNRKITIPEYYPDDAAKNVAAKIADAITAVEEDNTSFDRWLTLANLRQQIEDYKGAEEIYIYLNEVVPDNDISFLNLGNLYHLHLRDFEKAEENFRQAITNNVANMYTYASLHELYRYSYKTETTLAEDTLLEGIDVVADDINLLLALGDYYKEKERIADAIDYFTQVKEKAEKQGNKPLVDRMITEIIELQSN